MLMFGVQWIEKVCPYDKYEKFDFHFYALNIERLVTNLFTAVLQFNWLNTLFIKGKLSVFLPSSTSFHS